MKSRGARFAVLVLFLVALGVTSYLFRVSGSSARTEAAAASSFDDSARAAERGVLDMRGAQQAYVATGQGGDFWTGKVTASLATVRDSLTAIRSSATSTQAQTEIDAAVSTLQDFAQMDSRAREYTRTGQKLLASDLIFSNGLELTDSVLGGIDRARTSELQARTAAAGTFLRRQVFALAAAAAAAILVVLLLVPRVAVQAHAPLLSSGGAVASALTASPRTPEPIDVLNAESEGWSAARLVTEAARPDAVADTPAVPPVVTETARPLPPATAAPVEPAIDLGGMASLCTQLSRVEDPSALQPLLERTASLLDAAGIILWIADPDGRELSPIMSQGYPAQLVTRLGPIPRDAQNATAAAFRSSLLQTVKADTLSNGAIAAPLVTSGGCVGVMAAEVRGSGEKQEAKLAAATIVAAQLASLVGPPARPHHSAEAAGA